MGSNSIAHRRCRWWVGRNRGGESMKRIGKEPTPTDLGLKILKERIAVLEALKPLTTVDEFSALANLVHSVDQYSSTPSVLDKGFSWNVYFGSLNRFTDERLTSLLASVETLEPDESDMKEYKDAYLRSYNFKWKFEDDFVLQLEVNAYEAADTAECRRIQVGTKMVEQPIYRYDCVTPEGNSGELPAPVIALEGLV